MIHQTWFKKLIFELLKANLPKVKSELIEGKLSHLHTPTTINRMNRQLEPVEAILMHKHTRVQHVFNSPPFMSMSDLCHKLGVKVFWIKKSHIYG